MLSSQGRLLLVRIGDLELDERKRELRGASGRLAIQPKVFDVLVYLVRAHNRVVTRDELLLAIWPETTVGPDSITRALREVRRLLGGSQEVVRTYPSRGVRFVGQVLDLDPPDEASELELFGVDDVLASVDAVLARTTLTGRLLIVIGAPGTGKSTMLGVAERRARAAGFAVIRAAPTAALDRTVADAAAAATRRQPIMVVHDDLLRSSDAPDVDARRLASSVASAPVVVIAACCASSRRDPRVAAVLAAATRADPNAVTMLDTLARAALAGLAAHVLGRAASPAALAKLAALTGGNPRFARHILHLAKQADRPLETLDALPASFTDRLRELVLEHVGVVGAQTRTLLDAISILDQPFALDVAAEIAETGSGSVADCLAEAVAVGLVVETPVARWRFADELVRSVIERALAPSRRAAYHARAAAALERWLGTPPSQLDRIAHHYAAGASIAHAPRALEVVRMAAANAVESTAFDAAARWSTTALDIEALLAPPSPTRRRQLWLELAKSLSRGGQVERAAEALAAASSDAASAPRDGDAVRATFLAITPDLPQILERFYELLFERHPQVRHMFTRPAPLQRRMFGETLARLIDHVDEPEWLRVELEELGRRHVEYGVTEEMYGWARAAFLDAIAAALAPRRLPRDVRGIWERAFDSISAAMLASYDADPEPRTLTPGARPSVRPGRHRASGR